LKSGSESALFSVLQGSHTLRVVPSVSFSSGILFFYSPSWSELYQPSLLNTQSKLKASGDDGDGQKFYAHNKLNFYMQFLMFFPALLFFYFATFGFEHLISKHFPAMHFVVDVFLFSHETSF